MLGGSILSFTQEIADEICERLTQGESLISICKLEAMPSLRTVKRWLQDDRLTEFHKQYALSRDIYTERVAEEIIEIADNEPDPNKARVMIDARKWVASKLLPKKYGDRQQLEVQGGLSLESMVIASIKKSSDDPPKD